MKFCVSIYANKTTKLDANTTSIATDHQPFMVEAVSQDEAVGLATRIAHKLYPGSEGWSYHHARANPETMVLNYEGAVLKKGD